ncbi:MAG TPA: hypothetical protein VF695_11070 [Sphingomonas sp.]|jgi:hypothetical protein
MTTDNPLAFPSPMIPEWSEGATGMTLRDWFAGQALGGMLASEAGIPSYPNDWAGERAYLLADAMLAFRSEPRA